jgi:hypothetical protein
VKGIIQHFSISSPSYLVSIIDFVKIFRSYKFDTPTLEQQQPQVIAITPIEAVGTLYKIKKINDYLMSSFQVKRNETIKFPYKFIFFIMKITSSSHTIILQGRKYI